jgi:hypothetical protein
MLGRYFGRGSSGDVVDAQPCLQAGESDSVCVPLSASEKRSFF